MKQHTALAIHVPRFNADLLSDLVNCKADWLEACTDPSKWSGQGSGEIGCDKKNVGVRVDFSVLRHVSVGSPGR